MRGRAVVVAALLSGPAALPAACHPLDALPQGPPARTAYVDGGAVVEPDGDRTVLPGQRRLGVTGLTAYDGGWLVADGRVFEGSVGMAHVGPGGRTELGPCVAGRGAAPSHDERSVAWVTQGCPEASLTAPTLLHVGGVEGGERSVELDRVGLTGVAGFVGDAVVVTGFGEPAQLVAADGAVTRLPLRLAASTSATGLVAGLLPGGDAHAAVVEAGTGRVVWERRGAHPGAFNPCGARLVADVGAATVLLDARTGETLRTLRVPGRLDALVWQDERHLVGVLTRRGRQALVRVGAAGSLRRLGPSQPARWGRLVPATGP